MQHERLVADAIVAGGDLHRAEYHGAAAGQRQQEQDRRPRREGAVDEREVEVTFEDRRWVFPSGDCIILPVPARRELANGPVSEASTTQ